MYNLTVPAAISAVRKNLDESGLNESMMYAPPAGTSEATDNNSLDDTISKTLPEAINAVVSASPVFMLEGLVKTSENFTTLDIDGKIVHFSINDEVLRLVALQAFDTDHIVTEIISEATPEGRMQLNPSIRGTYDKPRLVQGIGNQAAPKFTYYSLKEDWEEVSSEDDPGVEEEENNRSSESANEETPVITRFEYIPFCRYESGSLYHAKTQQTPASYDVPHDIVEQILYKLTALVLAIYGENEKAGYYSGLAEIR